MRSTLRLSPSHASLVALVVALGGCGSKSLHVVRTETWFVPEAHVRDCGEARELLAREPPAWRLPSYSTRFGRELVTLHPTDELWVVEVEDGYDRPLGEREGFEATVRCGKRTYELGLLECSMEEGRRLFIPAHQLPAAGSPSQPCSFHLELTHGDEEWFDITYSLVFRPGLGRWRMADPHPASSR